MRYAEKQEIMLESIKQGTSVLDWAFTNQYLLLTCLAVSAFWFLFRGKKPKQVIENVEEFIENFQPDPLIPNAVQDHPYRKRIVESRAGKRIVVDGEDCLNAATNNYLGFVDDKEVTRRAADCISKYGVGSCGPRGFYGTADVHLELEERLAEFMDVEEACVYSYGFSTAASAIPAYCKRKDVIFADEAINFSIQKGLDASRSQIKYFRHNDTAHLEELLKAEQKSTKSKARRFLVVEGIYLNTGSMCPLPEIVRLRKKYMLRMFLDETISFGTLGATGKGVVEYFNIPKEEVDLRIGSMEGVLASVGGFCCGTSFIVEHQRLSGLGYCFSASLPPLLAVAALTSLSELKANPERIQKLHEVCKRLHEVLSNLPGMVLTGHELSPIKHLRLRDSISYSADLVQINQLSEKCFQRGLAVVPPSLLEKSEISLPKASLKVVANAFFDDRDIQFIERVLTDCCSEIF